MKNIPPPTSPIDWFCTAAQDGIHGGVAECTIHASHPTKPGLAYTLAEVYGFSTKDAEKKSRLMASAPVLAESNGRLRKTLDVGLELAGAVAACWEKGDLAAAVRPLDGWRKSTLLAAKAA